MMKSFSIRRAIQHLKENKSRLFWIWILYQAVKGSLSLTLIWIPLFLLWKANGGIDTFWTDWGALIITFVAFALAHVFLINSKVSSWLKYRLTPFGYWTIYCVTSIGLFVLFLWNGLQAPQDIIWGYQLWHGVLGLILISLGTLFFVFGVAIANPFSILSLNHGYDPEAPGILRVTRHPALTGITLWSLGHLIAHGEARFVVFFGLIALFSIVCIVLLDRVRRKALDADIWDNLSARTSLLPNVTVMFGMIMRKDANIPTIALRLVIWLIVMGVSLWVHMMFLSVSPLRHIGLDI